MARVAAVAAGAVPRNPLPSAARISAAAGSATVVVAAGVPAACLARATCAWC